MRHSPALKRAKRGVRRKTKKKEYSKPVRPKDKEELPLITVPASPRQADGEKLVREWPANEGNWLEIQPREQQELGECNLLCFVHNMSDWKEPFEIALVNDEVEDVHGYRETKVRYLLHPSTREDVNQLIHLASTWGFYVKPTPPPNFIGPVEGIIDIKKAKRMAPRILMPEADARFPVKEAADLLRQVVSEAKGPEASVTAMPGSAPSMAAGKLHSAIARTKGSALVVSMYPDPAIVRKLSAWAASGEDSFVKGVVSEMGNFVYNVGEDVMKGDGLRGNDTARNAGDEYTRRIVKKEDRVRAELEERQAYARIRSMERLLLCDIRTYGPPGFVEDIRNALPSWEAVPRCFHTRTMKEVPPTKPPTKPSMNSIKRSVCDLALLVSAASVGFSIALLAFEHAFGFQVLPSILLAVLMTAGAVGLIGCKMWRIPSPVILSDREVAAIVSFPLGHVHLPTINIAPQKPSGETTIPAQKVAPCEATT